MNRSHGGSKNEERTAIWLAKAPSFCQLWFSWMRQMRFQYSSYASWLSPARHACTAAA